MLLGEEGKRLRGVLSGQRDVRHAGDHARGRRIKETQLACNLVPWVKLHRLCICVFWQLKCNVKGLLLLLLDTRGCVLK